MCLNETDIVAELTLYLFVCVCVCNKIIFFFLELFDHCGSGDEFVGRVLKFCSYKLANMLVKCNIHSLSNCNVCYVQ